MGLQPRRPVRDLTRPQRNPRPGRPLVPARVWSRPLKVVRPEDLLVFTVSWANMSVIRPADEQNDALQPSARSNAVLRAGTSGGFIRFDFSFQHMAEFAAQLSPGAEAGDPPFEPFPSVPTPARAADKSRLVFKVRGGGEISYTIEGILAAMGRLELSVAPAATPAPGAPFIALPVANAESLSLTASLLREVAATSVSRVSVLSGVSGSAEVIEGQRAMVSANRLIAGGLLNGLEAEQLQAVPGRFLPSMLPEVRQPRTDETAIEAPFRLILSPSSQGGWAHALRPVTAKSTPGPERTELWHSRLGVREAGRVDELSSGQRIVRAIWTRDRDMAGPPSDPFDHSLNADDRECIVRQSAGTSLAPRIRPEPARVRKLALSSVGAWLDLHAKWDSDRYIPFFNPVDSWDHIAPMGRDQYVRIVRPGYLFPLGQKAYLNKITYRKIVGDNNPQAALFQLFYITLGDPMAPFSRRDIPLVSAKLSPGRTPNLKKPTSSAFFWPTLIGATDPFEWKISGSDHDASAINLQAPMLFVFAGPDVDATAVLAEYQTRATIPAHNQTIAFAPALAGGQGTPAARASAEVETITLSGIAGLSSSTPFLNKAKVVVPAIRRLTPTAPSSEVSYPNIYRDQGFGPANVGNVFLKLAAKSELNFGSSEKAGGFIRPDIAVDGLARGTGLVADVAEAAAGGFDAKKLFAAGLPKLFGLFDLSELIVDGLLDLAPKFITEALDRVSAIIADLQALKEAAQKYGEAPALPALATEVQDAIEELLAGDSAAIGVARITAALGNAATEIDALAAQLPGQPIDPIARATFDKLIAGLQPALKALDVVEAVLAFAEGFDPGGGEFRAKMVWNPKLRNFPDTADPIFEMKNPDKALTVSVEVRAAGPNPAGAEIAAQLDDFQLNLLPGFELMAVKFNRLAFRGSTARKPEVDVVFDDLEFVGILSFVEVLKELIPLDGFSDPPFLDVSTEGISAGFTIALPNVAIGVFSLTNISLGADVRVPFLGQVVSVGFNFCTRERPFCLAVAFLGGGGFIGLRLSPEGMVLLEGAFEFGAVVALDFGVASGSVSVMAGIYFKIEGSEGQLTGYLRIRGEVDVLSLISASIELYLALEYFTADDKLVGEASLKITVEVLFFSGSVTVRARRTFAGSNGDPTVRDMLLVDASGASAVWSDYLSAFAPSTAEA
jgi:hypothetical protein